MFRRSAWRRALTAMLTIASSAMRSTRTGLVSGSIVVNDVSAQRLSIIVRMSCVVVEIDHSRFQVLAAGEGQQVPRQARRAWPRPDGLDGAAFRINRLSLRAADDHRRLLKSWAMPPASLPIASIFCAMASCSRAFEQLLPAPRRSVASRRTRRRRQRRCRRELQ